ncbi:hypothetical protein BDV98DRAFT_577893 [Pterulicium gracile]|uniref:Uncharacterized protein n=1 Tax=Pterulicium gracile TaxID=1884261 RepID=A0A5C3Q2S3_9AGAR|nr:hypothetical protein BDV98DRAFT_577893 [Pterula gracilis]
MRCDWHQKILSSSEAKTSNFAAMLIAVANSSALACESPLYFLGAARQGPFRAVPPPNPPETNASSLSARFSASRIISTKANTSSSNCTTRCSVFHNNPANLATN